MKIEEILKMTICSKCLTKNMRQDRNRECSCHEFRDIEARVNANYTYNDEKLDRDTEKVMDIIKDGDKTFG